MGKNATIYDVAQRSGVSAASVSRVLSKVDYPVSKETRMKVLQAAKELNYTFNAVGKMLKQQNSHEIGVIVPNITNPCYAQLVQGIQSIAIEHNYHILLYNSYRNGESEKKNMRMLLEKRVDGILIVSIGSKDNLLETAERMNCKIITIEQEMENEQLHVGYDYRCAGQMATNYLIKNGHKRIGFIGARIDRTSRAEMLHGYRLALQQAGIAENEAFVWLSASEAEDEADIYEIENGKASAIYFSQLPQRPTGCVCINDLTALGAIQGFFALGMKVPQDVSIIGFDNIPYGEMSFPKLTTIDQHAKEMGREAMRMMIEQFHSPDTVQKSITFKPKLICRDSVYLCGSREEKWTAAIQQDTLQREKV